MHSATTQEPPMKNIHYEPAMKEIKTLRSKLNNIGPCNKLEAEYQAKVRAHLKAAHADLASAELMSIIAA